MPGDFDLEIKAELECAFKEKEESSVAEDRTREEQVCVRFNLIDRFTGL